MRLRELLAAAGLDTSPGGDGGPAGAGPADAGQLDIEVASVVADSRRVEPGALFCCVPGRLTDGHDHAGQAVAAGAVALLVERPTGAGVVEVRVPDVRAALGPLAAAFHRHPSQQLAVVGVTGTNGKTTVTHILASVLRAAGHRPAVIGTLGGARTTPEAPDLQALLAQLLEEGRTAVAMEVSSHALDQRRVDATRFAVAAFTNLGVDHLDHHGTLEAYYAAKARLFTPELSLRGVVNADDEWGRRLLAEATVPVVPYSLAEAEGLSVGLDGARFRWRGRPVHLPLLGRFNVSNALAAATVGEALGLAADVVVAGLEAVEPVPGRMDPVVEGQPFAVLVDFAHTPDGLDAALRTARELRPEGRVIVVFGCGGDRDRSKRPQMGAVASARADVVVITSDNPRSEDPTAIAEAVLSGIPAPARPRVELDRRAAIALALSEAAPGDVVVVAGKGHEQHQEVAGAQTPFDDRVVVRELLAARVARP